MEFRGITAIEAERQMPLMRLPVRTLVLQLARARLLFSPASTLTATQLQSSGEITAIVAPSLFHTAGMAAASRAFPRAELWGPAGARENLPKLPWRGLLGIDPWPYEAELHRIGLAGMPRANESVFLHSASRTLLVSDLVFNIERSQGLGAWLILSAFGTYRRLGVSRLFLKLAQDKRALRSTIDQVVALDFDHLIPAHGEPVLKDAKPRLIAALRERRLAA